MVPGTTGWARISSVRAAPRVREVGVGPWHWGSVGGLAGLALVGFLASCCIRCWHAVAFLTVLYRLDIRPVPER